MTVKSQTLKVKIRLRLKAKLRRYMMDMVHFIDKNYSLRIAYNRVRFLSICSPDTWILHGILKLTVGICNKNS